MGKGGVSAGNATAKQAGKLPKNLLLEGENVFGSSVSAVGNVENNTDDVYYQVENEGAAEGEPAFYSVASDDAVNKSIKQQIREKMGEIMLSPAVANVEYDDETVKTVRNMRNDVIHLLDERGRSTDSEVVREGFGAIDMSYQRLKNGLKYMNSALEIYSLPYVADVVKNGKQIYYESKHKATGNESFTFAAPININGVTYAMGVVVQRSGRTGGNKYHVHRVILPDGSSLVLDEKKETAVTIREGLSETERQVSPITAVSNTIISQDSEEYNGKNKKVNHGLMAADIENGNIPEGLRARLERYRNVMSRLGYNVIFAPNREVSPDVIGYADVVNKEVYLAPAHLSESLMMHELVHVIQKGFGGKYIKSLVSFVKQEFSSLWDEAAESATAKYANVSGANIEAEALAEVCVQLCDDKYIDFAVDMNPFKIKQISLMLRYMGAKIASVFGKNEVSHKLKLASLKWQLALYESARIADDARSSSSPVQRGGSVSGVGDDGVYLAVDDAGGGTHIDSRTVAGVGSRRVNAFQYNNPQVHPYYREIAEELLRDIGNTQRGVKYPTEGQQRRRRVTSESIARIKDGFGATYDEITHALKCIINDKGQENFALAKRIELVMDDMLSNGYVNLAGETIQANGEYIELKNSLKDEGDSVNRDAASRGIPSRQSVDRSAAATDDAGVSDRGAEGRRDTQDAPKRSNRGIDALRYYRKDADELLEELDSINFLIDSGELDPDTKLAALTKKHMIEKALSGKSKYVEDMLGRKMEKAEADAETESDVVVPELTGRAKRVSDTIEAYRRTGDARLINDLPSKRSLRSSERFRQGKVVQINRELDALYREYRDPETSATQKEEITAQINEALSALREIKRNNEVYKKVAELQDEVSTAARPNHSWLNQVVESVQDAEGNVVKEVTVANELRDRDNMLTEGKYGFNDIDRNFRHFFGKYYKKAYDAILKPLWQSTKRYAEGVNSYRERLLKDVVRGLGIKKGSKMSAAVMWLGEGRKPLSKAELIDKFGKKGAADILKSPDYENMSEVYAPYTYDDCVKEFGKENADKIKKATEYFRTYYDELIDEVNRVRAELYPNNPDKLVTKRKDYFHHFQEMGAGLQGLRNAFNINADIDPLLVGESEYTRPKSKWQGYMQRRLGYKTEYDAVEGFLRYLPAAMHSIHIDPNIVNVRALAYDLASSKADEGGGRGNTNANRFIEYLQSYANSLAGKTTSHIDRFAIQYMGRNFLAVMSWFNNKLKISAVLGNINSVLAQFSNFKNVVGLIENERDFFLGFGDAIASIHPDSPIRKRYEDSGFLSVRFLDKGESKFNTLGENLLPTTWVAKLLGLADEVGTRVTWCAGYREAIRKGYIGEDAILYADDFTRACVAGRGIGEEALLLRSQMAKLFLPFRTEVMNDIRVQQDILFGADADGKKPGKLTRAKNLAELYIASAIINSLIAAAKSDEYDPIEEFSKGYAADGFFAGLRAVFDDYADGIGNPVAFDPIYDIATGIYQGLSEGETDVEAAGYAFLRSLQNLAGDVVSNNPFSNLLLALLQVEPDTTDAIFNNSVYVTGGAGMPLMGNIATMIEEFKDGDYGAGLSIIPKSFVPMGTQIDRTVKGLYEYFTGYSTTETAYDRMLGNTGSLKYLIEPGFGNLMRSIFFGTAAWSGTASDFFDEGLWLEDEEVERVVSQEGYDARKDVFDEIVDDKRHARRWGNYEKEAKEIAESIGAEYYAGKEGTPLYEVYASEWGKNQENDAVPFKKFSELIEYSWDDVQYTNNITPELAVVMGSEYGERMKFWFDELNESELFANMDVEDRKEYLDTISGLEFNRVKVEWLHNIKRMPEKEYLEYVDYYNGKVVDAIESLSTWEYDKLEDEVNKKYAIADAYGLDDDVDSYTGWSAVNASGMYMEYYDGTMGRDAYNEIVRYARDASNRKPDSVDQELFRVSRASGSKVNLTGNPYNVLSYSKNNVKYKIDIPTDKVYGLCQEVESAMRSSISSLISKPSYRNASAEDQVEMIKSNQTSVRSRIKKKYKAMYPSVRVDTILTGGGGASGRVSDLFDEILNMK